MKRTIKSALLALSTGLIALSTGACLFRFFGDVVGDQFWLGRL